eukprot:TRINITY_DN1643_c0_g1_i1.p1 TRINITY_DN1643_c0_g1~~TRINITY_DN1643_c0_g1_i1.p1  ORF type:complete len:138 (-),score=0.67 TRINITY_DN1643_c0_g1_i1:194-607(-)
MGVDAVVVVVVVAAGFFAALVAGVRLLGLDAGLSVESAGGKPLLGPDLIGKWREQSVGEGKRRERKRERERGRDECGKISYYMHIKAETRFAWLYTLSSPTLTIDIDIDMLMASVHSTHVRLDRRGGMVDPTAGLGG